MGKYIRGGDGGGGNLTVTTDSITADTLTTSTSFVDSDLAVTFTTTKADEDVLIVFSGNTYSTAGAPAVLVLALLVAGGSDEEIGLYRHASNDVTANASFSRALTIATPGIQTVTLRMRVVSGDTAGVYGTATNIAKLQAIQVG